MTLWKSLYRNTTQEIINARKQKKVVEKFTSISSSLCVLQLGAESLVVSPYFCQGMPIFELNYPLPPKA